MIPRTLIAALVFAALARADVKLNWQDVQKIFPQWHVVHADEQPSLAIGGHKGWRLILRQDVKDYVVTQQQAAAPQQQRKAGEPEPPFVMRHNHLEIVLFPADAPVEVARIPWKADLAQQFHVQPVDMGQGRGFRWAGRMTLWNQDTLRTQLKLKGGDDRLALVIAGFTVQDQGSCTRNTCAAMVTQFGAAAVPALKNAALAADKELARSYASTIRQIPGDEATDALRELYKSETDFIRDGAAHGLVHSTPIRQRAKEDILDMLRRDGRYVQEAMSVCARASWKDALPLIEPIFDQPRDYWTFRGAWQALRALRDQPIPRDLAAARDTLVFAAHSEIKPTEEQIARTKAMVLAHKDRDAAVMLAVELAFMRSKGDYRQTNSIGADLLRQLPEDAVKAITQRLLRMKNPDWRQDAERRLGAPR